VQHFDRPTRIYDDRGLYMELSPALGKLCSAREDSCGGAKRRERGGRRP
jgi:hypothetical protein